MKAGEPNYSSAFTEDAFGDVKALDGTIRNKVKKVLTKKLAMDPRGYRLPLRSPLQPYWNHEFASPRLIYRIYEEKKLVLACAVGPRKQGEAADVYVQLQTLAQTGSAAQQIAEILGSVAPGNPSSIVTSGRFSTSMFTTEQT